jgi:hypothetical protein
MIKVKTDIINLILENPEEYIEDDFQEQSLDRDIYLGTRNLEIKWLKPIMGYKKSLETRRKINTFFKSSNDRKEKKKINTFISKITGAGVPYNTYFTTANFGFDFKKNKIDLFLNEKEFKGNIFCLGIDENYNYYVISPDFNGVRKIFHEMNDIIDIGYENIEHFAKTIMKFSLIQGSIEKNLINKSDVEKILNYIENTKLKNIVKEIILK